MKNFKCTVFLLVALVASICDAFPNVYPKIKYRHFDEEVAGKPLILTPLINQKKIQQARQLAQVHLDEAPDVVSYSAYLTVNPEYNSNQFFWFFPSQNNPAEDPVVLWLQGGPGATSLIGLFLENGPFSAEIVDDKLVQRKFAWTKGHSVLYIDNPVGTGYSFTEADDGYVRNETQVGAQVYEALRQFFVLFPELRKNAFFVTGESYGGKYVPAVSYAIHVKNEQGLPEDQINLQGLSMGNGLSDPVNQMKYGDYLYQLGLIDANGRSAIQLIESNIVAAVQQRNYEKAFELFDDLLNGDLNGKQSLFKNLTGFSNYFNYLIANDLSKDIADMGKYVQDSVVRARIHVGNASFQDENSLVETHLKGDVMKSVAPIVSILLNHYRVLIYNGQLDIIVAYPLTINYLNHLKFDGDAEYKVAQRYQWYVDDQLAGYVKHAGNLTEVLVRNAGHMVPADQPRWALDLITRFTRNKSFV